MNRGDEYAQSGILCPHRSRRSAWRSGIAAGLSFLSVRENQRAEVDDEIPAFVQASMPLKGSRRQPELAALQPPSTEGIVGMSCFLTLASNSCGSRMPR